MSIGVFDSGIGGLTVLKAMRSALPNESFLYFGDTARVPYGDKSQSTILRYSRENSSYLIEQGIELLVIACNTATAYALETLQEELPIPVIGVIEPGAKKAARTTRNQKIAVIGTKGTIRCQAYQKALQTHAPNASVHSLACPIFVPLIEEQLQNHPATRLLVQEALQPLKEEQIDTLLLGCTHYPLLTNLIQEIMGPNVTLVDSATSIAEEVAALRTKTQSPPSHRYIVTDSPEEFQKHAEELLGEAIEKPELLLRETL